MGVNKATNRRGFMPPGPGKDRAAIASDSPPIAMGLRMSLPKNRNSLADVADILTEISLLDQQGKAPVRVCR